MNPGDQTDEPGQPTSAPGELPSPAASGWEWRHPGPWAVGLALTVFVIANAMVLASFARHPGAFFDFTRRGYSLNTLWMPPLLLIAGAVGWAALRPDGPRGRGWRRAALACAALGLLLGLTRVWATHIEPHLLGVRIETFSSPHLARPLRILHISDVQSADVGEYEARAFAIMRGQHPDLIIHTGDHLQPLPPHTTAEELPRMAALMASLDAPLGKFNVVGDVDAPQLEELRAGLGGFRLLDGTGATVPLPDGRRLQIYGLTLGHSRWDGPETRRSIEDWLAGCAPGDFRLLIGHGPDFALVARDLPIDLCLAGHTHGGQIRLPWFGPIVTLSRVPRAWARGFRQIGTAWLDVSAGVGAEHLGGLPSIRINCRPEITVVNVMPDETIRRALGGEHSFLRKGTKL